MAKSSGLHCVKCGWNLRKEKGEVNSRKGANYRCPFCHVEYHISMKNSKEGTIYTFRAIKEEEEE